MANTNLELLQCVKDYQAGGISSEQWIFIYDFIERIGKPFKATYSDKWDDMKGEAMVYIMDKSMYNYDGKKAKGGDESKYCYYFMTRSIIGIFKKVLARDNLESDYIGNADEYTQLYGKHNKALENVYDKAEELGESVLHNNVLANIYKGVSNVSYIIVDKQGDIDRFIGDKKCKNGHKVKRTWYINDKKVKVGEVVVGIFGKGVRCYTYSQDELEKTRVDLLETELCG